MAQANKGRKAGQGERGELARAAALLSGLTLASRITGLLRDSVISALFGASPAADAFFVAFRIPNLLRRVVAEGASSTAFVPVLTWYRERDGKAEALRAAAAVGVVAAVVLGLVVVVGWLCSEQLVALFAPGFDADPAKREMTVRLTATLFPYVWLVGMAAWAMGTLHTFRRFAEPAYGPILLNLAIAGSAWVLAPRLPMPVMALVVGVLIGGVLQLAVQLPALLRLGITRDATLGRSHPAVARVGSLLIPTFVGGAVYQINILVATMFASMLAERSVSYLWYADRLFEFPLGIVAVAVGTAALPSLATHASAARYREMALSTAHALQLVWCLCIPATVGLWMLAGPMVMVLFERGEFTADDSLMTASALRAYSLGLLGVASVRVLVSAFYAMERPRVPVAAAIVALLFNALCDAALMGPPVAPVSGGAAAAIASLSARVRVADLDHVGLALATSLAATVNAALLFSFARSVFKEVPVRLLAASAAKHVAAAAVMAGALFAWSWIVREGFGAYSAYVDVIGGVLGGAVVYLVAALALGSEEVRDLIAPLWRWAGRSEADGVR